MSVLIMEMFSRALKKKSSHHPIFHKTVFLTHTITDGWCPELRALITRNYISCLPSFNCGICAKDFPTESKLVRHCGTLIHQEAARLAAIQPPAPFIAALHALPAVPRAAAAAATNTANLKRPRASEPVLSSVLSSGGVKMAIAHVSSVTAECTVVTTPACSAAALSSRPRTLSPAADTAGNMAAQVFPCAVCSKDFATEAKLLRHCNTHIHQEEVMKLASSKQLLDPAAAKMPTRTLSSPSVEHSAPLAGAIPADNQKRARSHVSEAVIGVMPVIQAATHSPLAFPAHSLAGGAKQAIKTTATAPVPVSVVRTSTGNAQAQPATEAPPLARALVAANMEWCAYKAPPAELKASMLFSP